MHCDERLRGLRLGRADGFAALQTDANTQMSDTNISVNMDTFTRSNENLLAASTDKHSWARYIARGVR